MKFSRLASLPIALLGLVAFAAPAAAGDDDHGRGGIELPWGLRLNGKFDVVYERSGFTDKIADGTDVIRNDHHFVFLSRQSGDDPYFLRAELIDLHFYEFGGRTSLADGKLRVSGRAGKLVVPFGSDPIFHHSYGGRSGFDQTVLPVIWSRHGAAVRLDTRLGSKIGLSEELYIVHGYELPASDAVLSLQRDLSGAANARFAIGNRLALSYGPVGVYYSLLYNRVGYDRQLLVQALDVAIGHFRQPVLDRLMLRAGVLRADVSGGGAGVGGPGLDYYHFSDYVELRVDAADWLYVLARTGLVTMNNRRDVFFDDTRTDEFDNSSHNVGVVGHNRGFLVGLYYFWNTEKANEQDNDILRLRVGYEF